MAQWLGLTVVFVMITAGGHRPLRGQTAGVAEVLTSRHQLGFDFGFCEALLAHQSLWLLRSAMARRFPRRCLQMSFPCPRPHQPRRTMTLVGVEIVTKLAWKTT